MKSILRIVLAFVMLTVIEKQIGYNDMLARPVVICAASVLCAFFPSGFISFMAAAFVLANMAELSLMMAAFAAIMGAMIFVLYYGYRPGMGVVISIVPLMCYFKIPFVIPLILGVSCGLLSCVPAALGVVCWSIVHYFAQNADSFSSSTSSELTHELVTIAQSILMNEYMYVMIFAFVLCIAVVSLISKSSMNNCWMISVCAGAVILAVVMIIGGAYVGGGSLVGDIVGLLVSFVIALIYVSVVFSVDFNKTEHLSYEDDDYYYYVKAVPKIKPDKGER